MKTFTSTQVQEKLQLSKTQVYHYVEKGGVIPFIESRGRGGRRKFSLQNIIEFSICKTMQQHMACEIRVVNKVISWLNDPRACDVPPIGYKPDTRRLSEISDQEFANAFKHPSNDSAFDGWERMTFWDMLRRRPETDETTLLFWMDPLSSDPLFGIHSKKSASAFIESCESRIITLIDISEIIKDLGFE